MLIRVGLNHLADADLGGADGRLGGGDVAVGADLGDVAERTALLLVAGDDRDQDLVLVDLLTGLFAVLHEYGAFRREGIGVLRDGEKLLVLDQIVLLLRKATNLILEGLDLDTGFLDKRIGHHQAGVFAVLLDRITK